MYLVYELLETTFLALCFCQYNFTMIVSAPLESWKHIRPIGLGWLFKWTPESLTASTLCKKIDYSHLYNVKIVSTTSTACVLKFRKCVIEKPFPTKYILYTKNEQTHIILYPTFAHNITILRNAVVISRIILLSHISRPFRYF